MDELIQLLKLCRMEAICVGSLYEVITFNDRYIEFMTDDYGPFIFRSEEILWGWKRGYHTIVWEQERTTFFGFIPERVMCSILKSTRSRLN